MVQDPEAGEDVLTVDGYRVADIKKQRGSRCTFCDYSKAIVICAYKKCKGESKIHSVKIDNFSVTQNLREINFGAFRSSKIFFFAFW